MGGDRKRSGGHRAGGRRADGGAVGLRGYQQAIFDDQRSGIVVLHWARQIGKSYTLSAWAVFRLISRPGRLVTVCRIRAKTGRSLLRSARRFAG